MRILVAGFGLTALLSGAPALAADQIIKLSECEGVTMEQLHDMAEYALTRRRYNIEENTPTMLVGEQKKLRVEMIIEPSQIVIRWKEGFGYKTDQWLRSLKTDVLWRLAE